MYIPLCSKQPKLSSNMDTQFFWTSVFQAFAWKQNTWKVKGEDIGRKEIRHRMDWAQMNPRTARGRRWAPEPRCKEWPHPTELLSHWQQRKGKSWVQMSLCCQEVESMFPSWKQKLSERKGMRSWKAIFAKHGGTSCLGEVQWDWQSWGNDAYQSACWKQMTQMLPSRVKPKGWIIKPKLEGQTCRDYGLKNESSSQY